MEKLPAELRKILTAHPKAKVQWDNLTPIGRRDFMSWIASARQEETRMRRIESIPSRLASGKKRPCCYALVPMNLYKALGEIPKAKATWQGLSADEKRDFTDWINEPKDSDVRAQRINKTCILLASGKRKH